MSALGRTALVLVFALDSLAGCARESDSTVVVAEAPREPAPSLETKVVLGLRAAARVDVGDDLEIELSVRNEADKRVTLVRPLYGSWELARHPRYELVWTDEQGQAIADPLGFAPGLECGTLEPITRADLVTIEPGGEAALVNGPGARTGHAVLPSARPGRYQLQVRYLAQGIAEADELQLLSAPVEVEIVGGDATLWSCRAEQVAAAANHEWVTASPAGLVARGDELWLIVSGYRHRVVDGEQRAGGAVWLQRLGTNLDAIGDPQVLRAADEELGWISVADHADGLTLVATPGAVGSRRVEAWAVALEAGRAQAGEIQLVQAGPGNPYVTRTLARGDRVAILHTGADADAGALMLSVVDRSGRPLGPARKVAAMATDFELVAAEGEGVAAIWLERGEIDGGVLQRFDGLGEPVGSAIRFELDPSFSLAGAELDIPSDGSSPSFELAWIDSSVRGDDRRDLMGIYARRFSAVDGTAHKQLRELTPESRTDARFGDAAWHDGELGLLELRGGIVDFGVDGKRSARLSHAADGGLAVVSVPDGFVALWTDRRDDASRSCTSLLACVAEVYGARFDSDGTTRVVARRLTNQARPKPFVAPESSWQDHCR